MSDKGKICLVNHVLTSGPMRCPNCTRELEHYSGQCRRCGTVFRDTQNTLSRAEKVYNKPRFWSMSREEIKEFADGADSAWHTKSVTPNAKKQPVFTSKFCKHFGDVFRLFSNHSLKLHKGRAKMKFGELEIGEIFKWQGTEWEKHRTSYACVNISYPRARNSEKYFPKDADVKKLKNES